MIQNIFAKKIQVPDEWIYYKICVWIYMDGTYV